MVTPKVEPYTLAVSVTAKTPLGFRTIPEIERALSSGADAVHVDIMDGVYTGRKLLGPDAISTIGRGLGDDDVYIEAHLIAKEPDVQPFIDAGADCVILHASGYDDPVDLYADMWKLRTNKVDAGIAFLPEETKLFLDTRYKNHLEFADVTVFMASFYGQKTGSFFPHTVSNVREYRGIDEECVIQVDGVNTETIREARRAGADILVASTSAVFSHDMVIPSNIRKLRAAVNGKREPVQT